MVDDDEFEGLFEEDEMLLDSQEPPTAATANLMTDDDLFDDMPFTPPTSASSQENLEYQADDPNEIHDSKPAHSSEQLSIAEKIEDIFDRINDTLMKQNGQLTIGLKTRPKSATQNGNKSNATSVKARDICFPGRSATEAWRFTVLVRILELMHEALSAGAVLSKRDLYYRDSALFGSQAVVDRYVDDIAFTLNVTRSKLNVTAAAKGLMAGALRFCRRDGSTLNAGDNRDGMLVPPLRDILSVDLIAVKWILVIEKEATFRSIASSPFWDTICTSGVILTGKGYPDIATRALLHFLSSPSPQNGFASPPVFGLADCDPDGLAILSIYRNGSAAMAHENEDLRVPQLQWLGLWIEHMMDQSLLNNDQGLLALTKRDRRRAVKMLERGLEVESVEDISMATALRTMLMLNTKAELQLLDGVPSGMTDLLGSTLGKL